MNRTEAVRTVVNAHPEPRAVIAGVGATSGALWASARSERSLYNMDFGYPAAVGLGLALARPSISVITLEGDGSAIAGIGVYCTIAEHAPANLTTVVLNNGVYGTGNAAFTSPAGNGVSLVQLARTCGIKNVRHATSPAELAELAPGMTARRPLLLVVDVDASDARSGSRPRVGLDFTECAVQFHLALGRLDESASTLGSSPSRPGSGHGIAN